MFVCYLWFGLLVGVCLFDDYFVVFVFVFDFVVIGVIVIEYFYCIGYVVFGWCFNEVVD